MSFQYIPTSHERASSRVYSSFTNFCHAGPTDDWIAQQSLFMGSHTPYFIGRSLCHHKISHLVLLVVLLITLFKVNHMGHLLPSPVESYTHPPSNIMATLVTTMTPFNFLTVSLHKHMALQVILWFFLLYILHVHLLCPYVLVRQIYRRCLRMSRFFFSLPLTVTSLAHLLRTYTPTHPTSPVAELARVSSPILDMHFPETATSPTHEIPTPSCPTSTVPTLLAALPHHCLQLQSSSRRLKNSPYLILIQAK